MAAKSKCAVSLGRKGGLATKEKKVGIFSPSYKKKKKATKKAAPKKKAAAKKATPAKRKAVKKKPGSKARQTSLF